MKCFKDFSKIYEYVKSALQNWIISHPYVIQYHIDNDLIQVNFDLRN